MFDITAKLFWFQAKEWCENMADKLSDIVYTDDSKEAVDVINLLLLGWILLGLIVYIVGNIIATQLRKRKLSFAAPADDNSEPSNEIPDIKSSEHVQCAAGTSYKSEEFKAQETTGTTEKAVLIPTCTGDDLELVEWINNVFLWLYNQRVVSPILESWLSALNARTRLASTEHGILVDFKAVPHSPFVPTITEVFETCNSRGDVNVTCQIEIEKLVFETIVTQFKENDKIVIPFTLNIKRLSGKVTIDCIPEELTFIVRFSEPPTTELFVESAEENILQPEDFDPLKELICEIANEASSSSIVNLRFSSFSECPKLMQTPSSDFETLESNERDNEEQLYVKIIKATNLGGKEGCLTPYCVVEMDEPPQKFETREVDEKYNPFWDESFIFSVKDISAELLFEVYDKGKPSTESFLGLGIVSVDELIKNPSQRQIIPLQSRPLENDNVTGSLTTEFLFLNQSTPVSETTHLGQSHGLSGGKTVETNSRVTSGGTVITTTTIKRTKEELNSDHQVSSNQKVNSFPNYSDWHFLTTLHEVFEEQTQKRNKHFDFNISTAITNLHDVNSSNKTGNTVKSFESENQILCTLNDKNPQMNGSKTFEMNGGIALDNHFIENKEMLAIKSSEMSLISNHSDMHAECKPLVTIKVEENYPDDSTGEKIEKLGLTEFLMHVDSLPENDQHSDKCMKLNDNIGYNLHLSPVNLPPIPENVRNSLSSSEGLNNEDAEADLTGTALKELEKHENSSAPSKSTLIIHSVQRVTMDKRGQWQEVLEPDSSVSESLEASPASHVSKDSRTSYSESVPSSPSQDQSSDDRSRPKEKKSFIGNLRRRLSFRKPRSRSAEQRSESASTYSQGSSRSASTDRIRHSTGPRPSPLKAGKFMGMKFLGVPGSTRSSISEASGISTSSSRTYISENSTLVIETNENGIIKRYLIPNSLIHRSKWKKRGVKLHIYNDHVFVAKHLSGSTTCQVCKKLLTRRPGKQGYECRGCNLQCHKSCHIKVAEFCSNSTINSMAVEYIQDPKSATPKSS